MTVATDKNQKDLRALLLELYLRNNPKLEHRVCIYTYQGVVDAQTNPFQYVSGIVPQHVKRSIILQNSLTGEMIQAFISPVKLDKKEHFHIENIMLYGSKNGLVAEVALNAPNIGKTEKYRQFMRLTKSLIRQFKA